ncbi:MAG: tetratricopeptide repeat protein [Sphingopyxis sp.]|nr:tetratricopeptide repeat protein [Sphingopyxis sp.]
MRNATILLAVLLVSAAPPTIARDDPTPIVSADHAAGKKAVAAKDWPGALKALSAAVKKEPDNADIHNLLGFSYRNSGQMDLAFQHYDRALKIDPRHLGAHEYVGEAYLMTNNLAKAEEHLAALKRHCSRVCEERDDLEKAIAAYRKRK